MAKRQDPPVPWRCPKWLRDPAAPDRTAKTFVPWESVRSAWDEIDGMYFHVAVQAAQDYFDSHAAACPRCGRPARQLFWLAVPTPDETWREGRGQVGWVTICQHCRVQVSFIPDPEATEIEAENRRLTRDSIGNGRGAGGGEPAAAPDRPRD